MYMYGHGFIHEPDQVRFMSFNVCFITSCEPFGIKPIKGEDEKIYDGKYDAFESILDELDVGLAFEQRS